MQIDIDDELVGSILESIDSNNDHGGSGSVFSDDGAREFIAWLVECELRNTLSRGAELVAYDAYAEMVESAERNGPR